jgi:hypothetical protein
MIFELMRNRRKEFVTSIYHFRYLPDKWRILNVLFRQGNINTDGKQFHRYPQSDEQPHITSTHWDSDKYVAG